MSLAVAIFDHEVGVLASENYGADEKTCATVVARNAKKQVQVSPQCAVAILGHSDLAPGYLEQVAGLKGASVGKVASFLDDLPKPKPGQYESENKEIAPLAMLLLGNDGKRVRCYQWVRDDDYERCLARHEGTATICVMGSDKGQQIAKARALAVLGGAKLNGATAFERLALFLQAASLSIIAAHAGDPLVGDAITTAFMSAPGATAFISAPGARLGEGL